MAFKVARRRFRRRDGFGGCFKLVLDLDGIHAEEQRQGLRRDVVGPLQRAAGILSDVGIVLDLEDALREGSEGLAEQDDVAAGGELLPFAVKGAVARWTSTSAMRSVLTRRAVTTGSVCSAGMTQA